MESLKQHGFTLFTRGQISIQLPANYALDGTSELRRFFWDNKRTKLYCYRCFPVGVANFGQILGICNNRYIHSYFTHKQNKTIRTGLGMTFEIGFRRIKIIINFLLRYYNKYRNFLKTNILFNVI